MTKWLNSNSKREMFRKYSERSEVKFRNPVLFPNEILIKSKFLFGISRDSCNCIRSFFADSRGKKIKMTM